MTARAAETIVTLNLTEQMLAQIRSLSEAISDLEKRQDIHEKVCSMRHERLDENLTDIKGLISTEAVVRAKAQEPIEDALKALNGRAWAAMSWLTGSLGAACAGLIAIIATHLLK